MGRGDRDAVRSTSADARSRVDRSDMARQSVRQRQQGRDAAQLARRRRARACSRRCDVCVDAGAPGITVHPRADERHITARDVREIAALLAPLRGRVEFNIEGDPAARPARRWCTRCGRRSARWCRCCPARSPARPAGRRIRRRESLIASRGRELQARRHPRQPVRRSGCQPRSAGRPQLGADRVELYTEPFARAFALEAGAGGAVVRAIRAGGRAGALRSVWASMPATISTSRTWCCSGGCRISTKCRSATRSSATRCSWVWTLPSATTSMRSANPRSTPSAARSASVVARRNGGALSACDTLNAAAPRRVSRTDLGRRGIGAVFRDFAAPRARHRAAANAGAHP